MDGHPGCAPTPSMGITVRFCSGRGRRTVNLLTDAEDYPSHGFFAGPSLADGFIAATQRYRQIFSRYPYAELRGDLAFVAVAGYTLNWDGLRIGTELGMRAQPVSKPNGDRYLLYSKEIGRKADVTGFY